MCFSRDRLCLLAVVGLLSVATVVAAEDWPHHRGPKYDAISRDQTPLTEQWPATGPPVIWRHSLGQGFSGLIAVQGIVYTQFQDRVAQYVIAFRAETGDELWRQQVDWPWQAAGGYPGPYATPTFSDGKLFYATPAGTFGCLDAGTGRKLWSLDIRRKFRGEGTEFGFAASPTVVGATVVLPIGAKEASVVAFSVDDGSIVWQAGDDVASYASIYPISWGDKTLLVAYLRNHVVLHDAQTGKILWREKISDSYDEHSTWPLFADNRLTIAGPFKAGTRHYELLPSEEGVQGKEVWFRREFSNDVCSSLLVDGLLFGFDLQQAQASTHRTSRGSYKCLEIETGKVLWETKQLGHGTTLLADRKLFVLEDTGALVMLRPQRDAYQELGRAQILSAEIGWSPPVVLDGRIFLRNPTEIVAVDLRRERPPAMRAEDPPIARPVPTLRWSLTPTMIVPHEPEFPHDAPTPEMVLRWFLAIQIFVFAPAILVAAVVGLVCRYCGSQYVATIGWISFLAVSFLLGLVGMTILGHWQQEFVLTWPASLYVAFRGTLSLAMWSKKTKSVVATWAAGLAVVLLLCLAWGYYQLCFFTGYVMAWAFLGGFGFAVPWVLIAEHTRRNWLRATVEFCGFAAYFGLSGWLPGLKDYWLG